MKISNHIIQSMSNLTDHLSRLTTYIVSQRLWFAINRDHVWYLLPPDEARMTERPEHVFNVSID